MGMQLGAVAFWLALAAVIIMTGHFRSRSEAQKHETLRRIIERTGQVDDAQLRALFESRRGPHGLFDPAHHRPRPPGTAYRVLRVLGFLLLFFAAGIASFFTILGAVGEEPWKGVVVGYAAASLVAFTALGLLFGARLLPRPLPDDANGPAPTH